MTLTLHIKSIILKDTLHTRQPFQKNPRSEQAVADARNAEGANCTALLTPRPPKCTENSACVHALLLKSIFTISLTRPHCSLSKEYSRGEQNEGDEAICIKV